MPRGQSAMDDEMFVKHFKAILQRGGHIGDLAEATGMSEGAINQRLMKYRAIFRANGQTFPQLARKPRSRKLVDVERLVGILEG